MTHETVSRGHLVEAYLLKELDAPQRDEFEEHFFTCELCAADLRAGASFIESLKPALQAQALAGSAPPQRPRWRDWFRFPVLAPYSLAAVFAALSLYFGNVALRGPVPQVIASTMLRPDVRGPEQQIKIPAGSTSFELSVDIAPPESAVEIRSDFRDSMGNLIVSLSSPNRANAGLNFLLPVNRFSTGLYTLTVSTIAADARSTPRELERFTFQVNK